ncbi:hypothetical protein BRI6_1099 [plant metagenome]|uniref:Uncharacterized protein n=1 Tax=plant metagenome TaxID=1297885 RepID=A0A484TGY8_9ZZZZ
MAKLIAQIPVAAFVDGKRVEIPPGEEVPGLSDHDARELVASGAVIDPTAVAAATRKAGQAEAKARRAFEEERSAVIQAQESTRVDLPADPAGD